MLLQVLITWLIRVWICYDVAWVHCMVISDLFLMSFDETRIFHKFRNFRIARANYGNEVYACDRSHAGVFARGIACLMFFEFLGSFLTLVKVQLPSISYAEAPKDSILAILCIYILATFKKMTNFFPDSIVLLVLSKSHSLVCF